MVIKESQWNDLNQYWTFLEHHGVKGMKWYQHLFGRYQKGAKYGKGSGEDKAPAKKSKSELRKEQRAKKKQERAKKKVAAAKARAEKETAKKEAKAQKEALKKEAKRQEILSKPSSLYKHRKEFTYEEIDAAMKKFDWEKRLNSYAVDRDKQLQERIRTGAEYINIMQRGVDNGIKLYNHAARIANTMYGENSWKIVKDLPKEDKDKKDDKDKKK